MPKPQREQKELNLTKVQGYIHATRNSFVVTNYQECVDAGILGYIEPVKTETEKDTESIKIQDLLKKYKPVWN